MQRAADGPDPVLLRACEAGDIAAVTAIYSHAVRHGLASFELAPPTEREMYERYVSVVQAYPYLVAAEAGTVVGYAYANYYRTRPAYRFTVENSVYVREDRHGRGIGKRLLSALIEETTQAGFRQMIAVIGDSQNLASIQLHAACGFAHAGNLRNTGWKHGRWLDTVLMQLALGQGADAPPADAAG